MVRKKFFLLKFQELYYVKKKTCCFLPLLSLTFLNFLVKEKQQHKSWLWLNADCDKFVPTFKNFSIKFE